MKNSQVRPLLLILGTALIVSILFASIGWIMGFEHGVVDLQLHDTYFVLSPFYLFVSCFILFSFLIVVIWLVTRRLQGKYPFYLLAGLSAVLVLWLTYLNAVIGSFADSGRWVIYPPMSAMENMPAPTDHSLLNGWNVFLILLQAALLILMGFCIYRGSRYGVHTAD